MSVEMVGGDVGFEEALARCPFLQSLGEEALADIREGYEASLAELDVATEQIAEAAVPELITGVKHNTFVELKPFEHVTARQPERDTQANDLMVQILSEEQSVDDIDSFESVTVEPVTVQGSRSAQLEVAEPVALEASIQGDATRAVAEVAAPLFAELESATSAPYIAEVTVDTVDVVDVPLNSIFEHETMSAEDLQPGLTMLVDGEALEVPNIPEAAAHSRTEVVMQDAILELAVSTLPEQLRETGVTLEVAESVQQVQALFVELVVAEHEGAAEASELEAQLETVVMKLLEQLGVPDASEEAVRSYIAQLREIVVEVLAEDTSAQWCDDSLHEVLRPQMQSGGRRLHDSLQRLLGKLAVYRPVAV